VITCIWTFIGFGSAHEFSSPEEVRSQGLPPFLQNKINYQYIKKEGCQSLCLSLLSPRMNPTTVKFHFNVNTRVHLVNSSYRGRSVFRVIYFVNSSDCQCRKSFNDHPETRESMFSSLVPIIGACNSITYRHL